MFRKHCSENDIAEEYLNMLVHNSETFKVRWCLCSQIGGIHQLGKCKAIISHLDIKRNRQVYELSTCPGEIWILDNPFTGGKQVKSMFSFLRICLKKFS